MREQSLHSSTAPPLCLLLAAAGGGEQGYQKALCRLFDSLHN